MDFAFSQKSKELIQLLTVSATSAKRPCKALQHENSLGSSDFGPETKPGKVSACEGRYLVCCYISKVPEGMCCSLKSR